METQLRKIINQKLDSLVDFILQKNPNADKGFIYHKLSQLNLYTRSSFFPKKNVLNTYSSNTKIKIQRSQFSNFILVVDPIDPFFSDLIENVFVIDVGSKTIIGFENPDGVVEPLTKDLVEICMKYKLRCEIPLNLNASDTDDDDLSIEVDELGLKHVESDEDEDDDE